MEEEQPLHGGQGSTGSLTEGPSDNEDDEDAQYDRIDDELLPASPPSSTEFGHGKTFRAALLVHPYIVVTACAMLSQRLYVNPVVMVGYMCVSNERGRVASFHVFPAVC